MDPSTLSNYECFSLQNTELSLAIDYSNKVVRGHVEYRLGIRSHHSGEIHLDTSYLDIHRVEVNGAEAGYELAQERQGALGTRLSIFPVNKDLLTETSTANLKIYYSTTKESTALQWLEPSQTKGKQYPYMFSQCQAIHARSLFPCFDTPSIKSTFDFSIKSPHTAVTSGLPVSKEFSRHGGTVLSKFRQNIPIPSYLVCIASGELGSAEIGPRSLLFTEPAMLKECTYEFEADTEKFIEAAEKIVFKYEWTMFNILVLPPSFPYGGMENPNMTFVTPTLISGDRENVSVIAHELAHSWSGNLVTNASWEHFWLNEGWTVYLERRILAEVYGEPYRHFSAIIGWAELENAIQLFGPSHPYTHLVVDMKSHQDPDDSFSTVPYEKGFNFLYYLEQLLGKDDFSGFIKSYFTKLKYKSVDTNQFKDYLYEYFTAQDKSKAQKLDSVNWELWLYAPGLPPVKPQFDTTLVDECYKLADKWFSTRPDGSECDSTFSLNDLYDLNSSQVCVLLDRLRDGSAISKQDAENGESPEKLTPQVVGKLGSIYKLESSGNAEVLSRWFRLALDSLYSPAYKPLANWLGQVGRLKFVRPGYRDLDKVDRNLAIKTFEKYRDLYHPICRTAVEKDLHLHSSQIKG